MSTAGFFPPLLTNRRCLVISKTVDKFCYRINSRVCGYISSNPITTRKWISPRTHSASLTRLQANAPPCAVALRLICGLPGYLDHTTSRPPPLSSHGPVRLSRFRLSRYSRRAASVADAPNSAILTRPCCGSSRAAEPPRAPAVESHRSGSPLAASPSHCRDRIKSPCLELPWACLDLTRHALSCPAAVASTRAAAVALAYFYICRSSAVKPPCLSSLDPAISVWLN
jgi:hypothetical protein